MNEPLLEKVKEHVLAEPRRVRMEAWVVSEYMSEVDKDSIRYGLLENIYVKEHRANLFEAADMGFSELITFPQCGTVACIAGWGKILSQPDPAAAMTDPDFLHDLARLSEHEAAELFDVGYVSAARLFHVGNWPGEFKADYAEAIGPEERARVVADRIDHFIATNGAE